MGCHLEVQYLQLLSRYSNPPTSTGTTGRNGFLVGSPFSGSQMFYPGFPYCLSSMSPSPPNLCFGDEFSVLTSVLLSSEGHLIVIAVTWLKFRRYRFQNKVFLFSVISSDGYRVIHFWYLLCNFGLFFSRKDFLMWIFLAK